MKITKLIEEYKFEFDKYEIYLSVDFADNSVTLQERGGKFIEISGQVHQSPEYTEDVMKVHNFGTDQLKAKDDN